VVKRIKDSGAEYVGLQEVSKGDAEEIATGLGWGTDASHLRTAFEHDGPLPRGIGAYHEGIAMVSKNPMTSENYEILPPELRVHPDGRGRKLQRAVVTKDGATFHLYNTHLASNDWTAKTGGAFVLGSNNDENRNQQAKWVLGKVDELEASATDAAATHILGGDMNTNPVALDDGPLAYRTLASGLSDAWLHLHPQANADPDRTGAPACTAETGCTITIRDGDKAKPPHHRIDFFFVKRGAESLIGSMTTPGPEQAADYARFSDHFPVQMVVTAPST
jgi:endonuclease/exonuclease/phosphatase family metal-dependent hydrolase